MNLNKLTTEIHNLNKEKGFWDGERNLSEALFLIITEMSEAIESHRKGKFADLERFENALNNTVDFPIPLFELLMKDSFEDEIADTIIRTFDLLGFKKFQFSKDAFETAKGLQVAISENVAENFFSISKRLYFVIDSENPFDSERLAWFVLEMISYSLSLKIDIQKHIEYKIQYNKTRPYLHGKKY